MTYRVEVTRRARREIDKQFDYLAARSVAAADRWLNGLQVALDSLSDLPERYPLAAPESEWYGDNLREHYFGKRGAAFRILFEVRSGVVGVLRIRHGRQDLLSPGDL